MPALFPPSELLAGLRFPESPRWFRGRLWISDIADHKLLAATLDGKVDVIAEFDDAPSGTGFLPDGSVLVVQMWNRQILRLSEGGTSVHADLNDIPGDRLNDMVVGGNGRAYVNNYFGGLAEPSDVGGGLVLVEADGSHRLVAERLGLPNGMAISPDGGTLIVAEPTEHRLSAFPILSDGTLDGRRLFADLGVGTADGIALDANGAVWVGGGSSGPFSRVLPDGRVSGTIVMPEGRWSIACALGGPERKHLFLVSSITTIEKLRAGESEGFVDVVEVAVPGAGWP
jgi:sugar lactone lactonase YvrE